MFATAIGPILVILATCVTVFNISGGLQLASQGLRISYTSVCIRHYRFLALLPRRCFIQSFKAHKAFLINLFYLFYFISACLYCTVLAVYHITLSCVSWQLDNLINTFVNNFKLKLNKCGMAYHGFPWGSLMGRHIHPPKRQFIHGTWVPKLPKSNVL